MGLFNFLRSPDINQGLKDYSAVPGAVLLDVRTPQEYREGHVPKSRNVPLQSLEQAAGVISDKSTPVFVYCYSGSRSSQAAGVISDKSTPVFVYCYSGSRSSQAVSRLIKMGYQNVKNIGGIASYSGKVEM